MTYQAELTNKLQEANIAASISSAGTRFGDKDTDKMIADELFNEFNLTQYDLHEDDIIRAIKIESILEKYDYVFRKHYALKIFYSIAKAGAINRATLSQMISLPSKMFEMILHRMTQSNLAVLNSDDEVEITIEGKSLAERLGIDIFI